MSESTDSAFGAGYLRNIVAMLHTYKALGEKAIGQAPDASLTRELDPNSNSIEMIVQHVSGNLRSRYRDFLTTDGEKPDRHRDHEFEPHHATREDLLRRWNDGFAVALGAIEALTPADLGRTVTIRGEAHTVVEALNRTVAHTAYHVGQIVYLARHFAGPVWTSLTIPRAPRASG